MCETLWRPKMTPEELFECISQAMMSALDRDASSGKAKIIKAFKSNIFILISDLVHWAPVFLFADFPPLFYHQINNTL